jgi:hypothetical protein
MKRSVFFIIIAIVGILFGGMLLYAPAMSAENFGWTATPEISLLFRSMGGMILSLGILNFLVRNEPDSYTLKAVLIFNLMSHLIGLIIDMNGIREGVLLFNNIVLGFAVHILISLGCIFYLTRINRVV